MTLKEISEMAGLNLQGVQKQFPNLVNKTLNEQEFNEVLDHYLSSNRVADEKKEALKKLAQTKPEFNWVYLTCVVLLISIQAWHFMHIAMDAARLSGRETIFWIDYLMGFLFESVAILVTIDQVKKNSVDEDKRQAWLYLFAFLAFITNATYYKLFTEFGLYETTMKFMASLALPVAILAFSHLFNKHYKA